MTIATVLRASLFCVCVSAAAQKDASTVFACNLKAISAAERPRYNELVKRVREAMRDRTEISNGMHSSWIARRSPYPLLTRHHRELERERQQRVQDAHRMASRHLLEQTVRLGRQLTKGRVCRGRRGTALPRIYSRGIWSHGASGRNLRELDFGVRPLCCTVQFE